MHSHLSDFMCPASHMGARDPEPCPHTCLAKAYRLSYHAETGDLKRYGYTVSQQTGTKDRLAIRFSFLLYMEYAQLLPDLQEWVERVQLLRSGLDCLSFHRLGFPWPQRCLQTTFPSASSNCSGRGNTLLQNFYVTV